MKECSVPTADAPILQGDIFLWRRWEVRGTWDRLGVIVTADCDIAQGKTPGFLSYVPLVSLATYIDDVWGPKKLKKEYATRTLRPLIDRVRQVLRQKDHEALPMTEQALVRWVLRTPPEKVAAEICEQNGKILCELVDLFAALRTYHNEEKVSCYGKLAKLCAYNDPRKKEPFAKRFVDHLTKLQKDVNSHLLRLPQDVFFIGDLPDLPRSFNPKLGFLAMLAHIRALPQELLTGSMKTARDIDESSVRFARLNDHYKFALSQGFAHLFARIGMPEEYETDRDMIIDDFCANLGQKEKNNG